MRIQACPPFIQRGFLSLISCRICIWKSSMPPLCPKFDAPLRFFCSWCASIAFFTSFFVVFFLVQFLHFLVLLLLCHVLLDLVNESKLLHLLPSLVIRVGGVFPELFSSRLRLFLFFSYHKLSTFSFCSSFIQCSILLKKICICSCVT